MEHSLSGTVSEMTRVEEAIANLEDGSLKKTITNSQSNEDEYYPSRVSTSRFRIVLRFTSPVNGRVFELETLLK